jgi:DNA-binding MarR family transcriptional regulator
MNKQEYDVLSICFNEASINQKNILKKSGYSLGMVNNSLKELMKNNFLDANLNKN